MALIGENGELETLVNEENNQLAVQLTIGVLSAVDSLKENNETTTNTSLVRILIHTLQKRSEALRHTINDKFLGHLLFFPT
jgi:hypothetical protein